MTALITTTLDSPIGQLRLFARAGAITGIHMPSQAHMPVLVADEHPDDPTLRLAVTQLTEYFAGTRQRFELPLAAEGTAFQRLVWDQLVLIPHAMTISYGELARRLGRPHASRAVGTANGRNPVSIVVPCHRVIGGDGTLTGYGGGLPAKKWLLEHERRHLGDDGRGQLTIMLPALPV